MSALFLCLLQTFAGSGSLVGGIYCCMPLPNKCGAQTTCVWFRFFPALWWCTLRLSLSSIHEFRPADENRIQWKRTEINDYRFVDLSVNGVFVCVRSLYARFTKPQVFVKCLICTVYSMQRALLSLDSIFWTHRVNIDFATRFYTSVFSLYYFFYGFISFIIIGPFRL